MAEQLAENGEGVSSGAIKPIYGHAPSAGAKATTPVALTRVGVDRRR
jgi:hypothetical protein